MRPATKIETCSRNVIDYGLLHIANFFRFLFIIEVAVWFDLVAYQISVPKVPKV